MKIEILDIICENSSRERERKRERIQLKKWTNLCFNNGIEMGKINFNKEIEMRNINFNKEIETIKINFVLFVLF